MDRFFLVVDLTHYGTDTEFFDQLERPYHLCSGGGLQAVEEMIGRLQPYAVCFDYDYPDAARLIPLVQAKERYPSVPVIMATQQHSEALAVWALRARIWDFVVKPLDVKTMRQRLGLLYRLRMQAGTASPRTALRPVHSLPAETRFRAVDPPAKVLETARAYVRAHLAEPIRVAEVAHRCGLSRFQFSRSFTHLAGESFQEFVVRRRVEAAQEALHSRAEASITDIALSVGFNDVSYFCRVFRREVGEPPSVYRRRGRPLAEETLERPALRLGPQGSPPDSLAPEIVAPGRAGSP